MNAQNILLLSVRNRQKINGRGEDLDRRFLRPEGSYPNAKLRDHTLPVSMLRCTICDAPDMKLEGMYWTAQRKSGETIPSFRELARLR
jgi:hypothetical protein